MKKIIISLILLFSINVASAQSVCEPGCAFTFEFNTGGTLLVTQDVTFIYAAGSEINLGDTGTVNTAVQPASLDFSAGGVLKLSAGESITFDRMGRFYMAPGSNLSSFDYTVTGGNSEIVGGAGATTITIHGAFSTDGLWAIQSSQVDINNDVNVSNGVTISNGNSLNATIIGGTGNINTDTLAPVTINGSIIDNIGGTISVSDINLVANNTNISIGIVKPLENLTGLQGVELPVDSGVMCTVAANECITDNGDIYSLVNGKLTKQQDESAGSFGAGALLMLFIGFLLRAFRKDL